MVEWIKICFALLILSVAITLGVRGYYKGELSSDEVAIAKYAAKIGVKIGYEKSAVAGFLSGFTYGRLRDYSIIGNYRDSTKWLPCPFNMSHEEIVEYLKNDSITINLVPDSSDIEVEIIIRRKSDEQTP